MRSSILGSTDSDRVETYTRWTLLGSLAAYPLLAMAVTFSLPSSVHHRELSSILFLSAISAATTLVGLKVNREIRASPRDEVAHRDDPLHRSALREAWQTPLRTGMLLALLVVSLVAALQLPIGTLMSGRVGAVALTAGLALAALSPHLNTALSLGVGALTVGVLGVLTALAGGSGAAVVRILIVVTLAAGAMALSIRLSIWVLSVVRQLDRDRTAHAQLAVAEERLRFSRDLHDVVGRALTTIAVKSELAAELSRRGHDGAPAELAEIRDLTHETMREVRAVVAGYRTADLSAELAGARSVLTAAGARTTVTGVDAGALLTPPVQQAIGWVIREAVTNVVRHAAPTSCTIDLQVGAHAAELVVINDGTRPSSAGVTGGTGTGLIGLHERLAALGGGLDTVGDGSTFALRAWVPLSAGGTNGSGLLTREGVAAKERTAGVER